MDKKKKEDSKEMDGNRVDILTIHNNLMYMIREEEGDQGEVDETENDTNRYYYLIHAMPMLERYKEFITKQAKIQFMGTVVQSSTIEETNNIIREYLKLVKRYFPSEYLKNNLQDMDKYIMAAPGNPPQSMRSQKKQKCIGCQMENIKIAVLDSYFICESCGYIYESVTNDISFKDIDRINISNKYQYDRRTHFKDCLNQYQGKQNATIDAQVYQDLKEQFRLHHLIPENFDELPKEEAFKEITKEHVMLFLKETDHTKHYEDVVLIHHQLTGKPTPDISHLENQMLHDFDQLTDLYDKKYRNNERKNFINTNYVTYQLLKRHKFPCKKEDFNILKTIDRKYFHDTIMQNLFESLGWNIHPLF